MDVDFIGMPINLGCRRAGVESGTSAIREIIYGHSRHCKWNDLGDIPCASVEDAVAGDDCLLPYISLIADSCTMLREAVASSLIKGHFPFVAGGDHVLEWGTLSGVLNAFSNPKCLYIDAHGDFNSAAESPSHNVHGMHMCYLMGFEGLQQAQSIQNGRFLNPCDVFFCGTRSLDSYEREMASDMKLNISRCYPQKLTGAKQLHISLDIDALDPEVAPATGVPEPDGLMPADVMKVLTEAFRSNNVVSFDMVEFNPSLDVDGKTHRIVEEIIDMLDRDLLPR